MACLIFFYDLLQATEEAPTEEPAEPVVGLSVLLTSSSLNDFFPRAMLSRLVSPQPQPVSRAMNLSAMACVRIPSHNPNPKYPQASMGGEDGLPKIDKIVAVDWPQGKHGHLPVEELPEGVEVKAAHRPSHFFLVLFSFNPNPNPNPNPNQQK